MTDREAQEAVSRIEVLKIKGFTNASGHRANSRRGFGRNTYIIHIDNNIGIQIFMSKDIYLAFQRLKAYLGKCAPIGLEPPER